MLKAQNKTTIEDGALAAQQGFIKSLRRFLDKKPKDLTCYEKLREHIHAHPELSDREAETAALIAKQLRELQTTRFLRR